MSTKKIKLSKKGNFATLEDLSGKSKEELIEKIRVLQQHNEQLKNIINKSHGGSNIPTKRNPQQKPFDFTRCNFRHVLLKVYYLGWKYDGFVVQENTPNTVEHHLFEALVKTCLIKSRSESNYQRCGRTDKGVSAFSQVISIDLRSKLTEENQQKVTEELDYLKMLNKVLPEEIACISWAPVSHEFSSRFDCVGRTYKYFLPRGNFCLEKMRLAALNMIGNHDFRNFCKMDVGNGVVEFHRTIDSITIEECDSNTGHKGFTMCVFTIKANAFLWHQIRCIMGVLLLIGSGREDPDIVKELLDVNSNPRKPDYNLAADFPLNLYECSYGEDSDLWVCNEENLESVISRLSDSWVRHSVKANMIQTMIIDLRKQLVKDDGMDFTKQLLGGVQRSPYQPLMKRTKCDSLEKKIEHYVKRCKLEIVNDCNDKVSTD